MAHGKMVSLLTIMAGVQLASLLLLCFFAPRGDCRPNWFHLINPQITVIRCSHEYLHQYGTFCLKFPVQWNTTNPSPPNPAPAPPPEETASPEEPPSEAAPATEEPVTTQSPEDESATTVEVRTGLKIRRTRGINVGPSFSLSLPPLKPPVSVYLPPYGPTYPAHPPSTVIVHVSGSAY